MGTQAGGFYSNPKLGRFQCPVCGTLVDLRCRWDEWGCYYRRDDKHKVMCCSQPCVKEYARQDLARRAEELRKSKGYQFHRYCRMGMTCQEAARAAGVKCGGWSLSAFGDLHWQEIEYLDRMETA